MLDTAKIPVAKAYCHNKGAMLIYSPPNNKWIICSGKKKQLAIIILAMIAI